MSIRSWLRSVFTRPAARTIRKTPRRPRLTLEVLEDRWLPSVVTVTNLTDDVNGITTSIAALIANPGDDGISLREAVEAANANPGADTITFDFAVTGTITLGGEQLTLTDPATTTITGPGANLLAISGNYASRVFGVTSGASAALSGLTVTGGIIGADGAGLYNEGTTTLTNCIVSANGVYSSIDAEISYAPSGAGVFNSGTATLTNCTIANNRADGLLTGSGGGVFNSGTATLTNCTLSGNVGIGDSPGSGGGVFNSGTATLTNCTLSGNYAVSAYGISGIGGGVFNSGTATLNNTIVASNSGDDVVGPFTGSNNLIGGDPMLGPLDDNGGPTQTMALLPGSPAINAGSNALIAIDPATGQPYTTDQRGFDRVAFGVVDIGAYESDFETPSLVVTTTDDVVDPTDGETSLREAIAYANAHAGEDTITFSSRFDTQQTITLSGTELELTDPATTTITGPGANLLAINGGGLSRVFNVGVGASAALSGLTITGGNADNGGGLSNSGTATLTDCTVSANSATGGGGGIFNSTGDPNDPIPTLTLNNCTISGNSVSPGNGGGVFNSGTATLTNCTISENSVSAVQFSGGGYEPPPPGSGAGGGVFNSGTATLTNCTISKNSASGLFVDRHGNFLGSFFGRGGGLSGEGFTLANTIVAGNSAELAAPDVSGSVTSGGHNLIGITDGSTDPVGGNPWLLSDLTGTSTLPRDPMLDSLANHGGPTPTMALLAGSPAINAGTSAGAPSTDQRGLGRVGAVDIGAFEYQTPVQVPSTTTATGGTFTYDGHMHAGSGAVDVPGGVVTLFYQGTGGTTYSSATPPTNAGTYSLTATYAGDATHLGSTASAALTITARSLDSYVTGSTQAALNVSKEGDVVFQLDVAAAGIVDGQTVAQLFNGAVFTLRMRTSATASTYETIQITSTATVVDGSVSVTLNLKNNATAYNFLAQGVSAGETNAGNADWEAITLSAASNGGNYSLSEDVLTRIFKAGK
jgi:CSLREA domain-containing protein